MSKLSSSKGKLSFKRVSERNTISKVKKLFKLGFWPELVSISPLKNSFREVKKTKNVKTNILKKTSSIFVNLEQRNILIVLHKKIPKLNVKENIDTNIKML